jgi:hypothetical protein
MDHPQMDPTASRDARGPKRRLGKAALVLAVLAGCAAVLVALVTLIGNTGSPVEGPGSILLALGLVASPVVAAVFLIARILRGGHSRDDGFLP